MHPVKKKYADGVFQGVLRATQQMVEHEKNSLSIVLKISPEDAQAIINKIIVGLPVRHFHQTTPDTMNKTIELIANLFILFQVQEDLQDDDYAYHLINFIECVSEEIDKAL
ncbi:MAG: hypothetical protein ACOYKA_02685 [Legionellaceae bacterium]